MNNEENVKKQERKYEALAQTRNGHGNKRYW